MTREAYVRRARGLYESLWTVSRMAAEEASEQAGLPEVWVWCSMSAQSAHRLSVACQVRLLEMTS